MNSTKPVTMQLSEADMEKLREAIEKINSFATALVESLKPAFELLGEAASEFMRSMSPELLEVLTQLGEREERKEMSRKKYERMMARRKPRVRKSRRRW